MKQLRIKKRISRWAALLLSLVLLLSVCSVPAFAYERIDTAAGASLTAHFTENGTGMQGVLFRLYRVAEVSDAVEFELTSEFSGAAVSLDNIESTSTWSELALTLSAYAGANAVAPVETETTGSDGSVIFSGLPVGLYLLVGDSVVVGDYSYAPTASMILLPALQEDDSWSYTPSVDIKYTKTFVAETQDVTVKKVWSDGDSDKRPDSVSIQLLRDGTLQDTVTLNADNSWTCIWKDLTSTYEGENSEKKTYTYTVNESDVPSGYTVSISQNGTAYTVTNTKKNSSSSSTASSTPTEPTAPTNPSGEALPQTGLLNWPIPVMTIAGLLLVACGWYLVSRKKET